MQTAVNHGRFMLAQWKVNLASVMAYRASFLSQAVFMFLNDFFLLFLWWVLLQNFESISGWGMPEIWLMYGLSAGGFSLMALFAANSFELSSLIAEGQLDYYLALPKNALLHVLISRMDFSGMGDLVFGLTIGALGCAATGAAYSLFLVMMVNAAAIMVGFFVIVHSLAFFLGRSEMLSRQISESLLSFSMYPGGIYRGLARFLIFYIIPAGFMVHLPVEILRAFDRQSVLHTFAATVVIWILAITVFHAGLRRYESGNQITLRG